MKFASQLTKEQIVIFIKRLFGKDFKAVSLEKPKDNEIRIHGTLKLAETKGSIPISFDNFSFIVGFSKIDASTVNRFGGNLTKKNRYVNRKFRMYLNEIYGEKYYSALKAFLEKDEKIEKFIAKQKTKLIEEKYNFLDKEIKTKILKLEKELKESTEKREKELESVNIEIEELITSNQEILNEIKNTLSETLTKN